MSQALKRILFRSVVALCAAVLTAFVAAMAIAILDIYLSGHGHAEIRKEAIAWPAGMHLSIADVLLLALTLAAGGVGWVVSGRRR